MSSTSLRRVGRTRKPRVGSWASQPSWASSSRASRTGVMLMPSSSAIGPRRRMSPGLTLRLRIRSRTTDATPCLSCSRRMRSRGSAIVFRPFGKAVSRDARVLLHRGSSRHSARTYIIYFIGDPCPDGIGPLHSASVNSGSGCDFVSADQLAGDHVALDLVGPLADDHEGSIPEIALNIKLG